MITDDLKKSFLKTEPLRKLITSISSRNISEISINGITDSAKGFFLSSLLENNLLKKNILFLAANGVEALNIYYEISNLSPENVFYFCGHEVSPYDQISSDPEIISYQLKTLTHLLHNKSNCLIISTAKYLSELIWNKEDLINNSFEINLNSNIDLNELSKKLVKLGYKKSSVVSSRGEFAHRGDILDIYPMVGHPTRVNFFGDEIESIKKYSLTSQRSLDDTSSIVINPRFHVINVDSSELVNRIKKIINHGSLSDIEKIEIENLSVNPYHESVEYYAHLINQRQSSLFNYLSDDTVILVDDWESNVVSLESWEKRNINIESELLKNKKIISINSKLLLDSQNVIKNIKEYQRVFVERFEKFDEENLKGINLFLDAVPRFSNQIELFVESVKKWIEEKNKIFIFTDQPQRVNGLLKEWEVPSIILEDLRANDIDLNNIFISHGGTTNGFKITNSKIIVLTDQEIFGTKRKTRLIHSKKDSKIDKHQYYTNIEDLKLNDFVVHIKHGIGRYRGLVKITVDDSEREYLMIEYASEGKLYLPVEQINVLYRYRGAHEVVPKLSKLGGSDWELTKKKVKKAIKKVAEDLLNLYTARAKLEGFTYNKDSHWQIEMEEAFPYTETPDQLKAINDVKKDMESTKPMDRLVCGDVGYGKTEVAIRAIFKAILSGKQVAVLVPTTILAQQHFNVISERLAAYPTRVAMLSRFRSNSEQKITIAKLALGEVDVIIGTHRLLQKDVMFKDLGLVVIDEEQRFGVIHKEKLKRLRVTVDVLTMSATPIPRTLYMALSGARDLSLINTPPTNRLPIKTFVGEFKPTVVKNAILHEIERGGQIYFVHNRIETIDKVAAYLQELVPEAVIGIGHGRLNDQELENVMYDFSQKKYNILVSTTIIESGLDIPNVNTIIVDNADNFGLAQLYQLRGRVGRTDIQAYAYCLYEENKVLTEVAKNRLDAIKEFSSLGSGYQIALRDMEIRGIGNILGAEQHGHMVSVGFDLYCQLLNEAVDKLRGIETNDIELECEVDINVSAFIPDFYIADENQKVIEYKRLASVKNIGEIDFISNEWKDRFGKLPDEVNNLLRIVELRLLASKLGINSIKTERGLDSNNIKIEVNYRLQEWIRIQKNLPQRLIARTSLKSVARGGTNTASFIILKTIGLNSDIQLELLFELLHHLQKILLQQKIA